MLLESGFSSSSRRPSSAATFAASAAFSGLRSSLLRSPSASAALRATPKFASFSAASSGSIARKSCDGPSARTNSSRTEVSRSCASCVSSASTAPTPAVPSVIATSRRTPAALSPTIFRSCSNTGVGTARNCEDSSRINCTATSRMSSESFCNDAASNFALSASVAAAR